MTHLAPGLPPSSPRGAVGWGRGPGREAQPLRPPPRPPTTRFPLPLRSDRAPLGPRLALGRVPGVTVLSLPGPGGASRCGGACRRLAPVVRGPLPGPRHSWGGRAADLRSRFITGGRDMSNEPDKMGHGLFLRRTARWKFSVWAAATMSCEEREIYVGPVLSHQPRLHLKVTDWSEAGRLGRVAGGPGANVPVDLPRRGAPAAPWPPPPAPGPSRVPERARAGSPAWTTFRGQVRGGQARGKRALLNPHQLHGPAPRQSPRPAPPLPPSVC